MAGAHIADLQRVMHEYDISKWIRHFSTITARAESAAAESERRSAKDSV